MKSKKTIHPIDILQANLPPEKILDVLIAIQQSKDPVKTLETCVILYGKPKKKTKI